MAQSVEVAIRDLKDAGVEVLPRNAGRTLQLPIGSRFEPPCSLKWLETQHSVELGAFSYHVSGYSFAARIGRYCSFGEGVQIGRQNHPTGWASTSPVFYHHDKMFDVGAGFQDADHYAGYKAAPSCAATKVAVTTIGHDVWIGHGAYIAAGVTIETGAIIAAHAVVTKDVPAYSVVAGNPAVIKRFRLPPDVISPMLKSKWWEFAPWNLAKCDASDPRKFVHQVMQMRDAEAYAPQVRVIQPSGKLA